MRMSAQSKATRRDWDRLTGLVVTLGVLAWAAMALGREAHAGHHGHTTLGGWLIMVVAMMLPPALPLFRIVRGLTRSDAYTGLAILIFVLVWILTGVVLTAGTDRLGGLVAGLPHEHMLLGAGLVLAGAWQFTPWKDACLTACRTPRGIAMTRWRGDPLTGSVAIAGVYAASCVGCCWALMAVGLLTGATGLGAMAVLTLLMAAERLTRAGRVLVRPAGAAAVILGVSLLLGVDALFT
ncbi:DUF2182 domain-containing protein [Actinoplanes sp. NPDC049265]|uniref:DUF2182 domain-containing protein n=1 Tax=Actinoplanes sp. NPDC049265 TaxID=3363902 RepID=UPI0037220F42